MKRVIVIAAIAMLMLSCGKEDKKPETLISQGKSSGQVFYASIEGQTAPCTPNTKVYADENLQVLWNADDRISIFNQSTYNYQYKFNGEDGDNYGSFEEIPVSGFISANPISQIIAVYPYATGNKVNNTGTKVTMTLPAEQTYKEHSFGVGTNSMIAVTENNFLAFKNVCGYLSFRFYGDDISISSITLRGNNGEKIAGKASIAVSTSTTPVTTMDASATEEITLTCNPAVEIGSSADDYTEFWFVVPPTTFSSGFTITVTDALGGTYEKSTSNSFTVTRNQKDWMNPLKVEITYDEENTFVPFEDANFKAYCVENFDTNSDGEISIAEARNVTSISVYTDKNHRDITSLGGVEFFTNLDSLTCWGYGVGTNNDFGQLICLDVSKNIALTYLNCNHNQLTCLDVSHNTSLSYLNCNHNQLTCLDVSHNTSLSYLDCSSNQLTSLNVCNNMSLDTLLCSNNLLTIFDISYNTILTFLRCSYNQLTTLDVSNNTSLRFLGCFNNQLTSLDVSHNNDLTRLYCYNNLLTTLDVSHNTALTHLYCYYNQLTTLDVSHNPALTYLKCYSNHLTSIDVSYNSAIKELTAWPQSGTLETLYKKAGQSIAYYYSVGYSINPSVYGTTIVEVD